MTWYRSGGGTDTSDATATASDILSGKTAYVDDEKVSGTMTNQGAKTSTLNCGESYVIPAGFHNGSGLVTANSLASQTSGTATAEYIVNGYTAWVNGEKITGTNNGELHGAIISCTTYVETLLGTIATLLLNNEVVQSTTINTDGTFSFTDIEAIGTYGIYVTDGTRENIQEVEITAEHIVNKTVVSAEVLFVPIVTWADGSYEKIVKMIEGHYNGDINIADYWSVGDVRSVNLSAMRATEVGESHVAQTVEFVIIGIEHDDLVTPINGKTKSAITIHMKNCLYNRGYMNSGNAYSRFAKYSTSARRTWINNIFEKALPAWLQNAIKPATKQTCELNNLVSSTERCFIVSNWEVFGAAYTDGSYGCRVQDGNQYDYYKTQTNRIKQSSGSIFYWWTRSGYDISTAFYVGCDTSGKQFSLGSAGTSGLAIGMAL